MPAWFGAIMSRWLPHVKRHNVIDYRANAQGAAPASSISPSSGGDADPNGDGSGVRPLNRYIDRKTLSYSRNRFKKAKGKRLGGK